MALLDSMGLVKEEVATAATIVLRTNLNNKPYEDKKVRNALQLAVDNATVLKLGYNDAGSLARTTTSRRSIRSISSCRRLRATSRRPRR